MIVYYSEYSMFVVGDYVPKWLPNWASQLKTIISNLKLQNLWELPVSKPEGLRVGSVKLHKYTQYKHL